MMMRMMTTKIEKLGIERDEMRREKVESKGRKGSGREKEGKGWEVEERLYPIAKCCIG